MENSPKILLADENGLEKEYYVIYSFDRQDGVRHYTIYSDLEEDEVGEVSFHAMYQDEGEEPGTYHTIEDDADWELIDSVMEAFMEEE